VSAGSVPAMIPGVAGVVSYNEAGPGRRDVRGYPRQGQAAGRNAGEMAMPVPSRNPKARKLGPIGQSGVAPIELVKNYVRTEDLQAPARKSPSPAKTANGKKAG